MGKPLILPWIAAFQTIVINFQPITLFKPHPPVHLPHDALRQQSMISERETNGLPIETYVRYLAMRWPSIWNQKSYGKDRSLLKSEIVQSSEEIYLTFLIVGQA